MASTTAESTNSEPSINNGVADGIGTVPKTLTFESLASRNNSLSTTWPLNWKKILETVSLSCVILGVWGIYSLPTIFYALPPLQVSLALSDWVLFLHIQKIYYSLQQQKAKSVKHSATITELVVVWSLCSVYTSVTKSKAVILYNTSRFLL